jgi:hypothetical protein
MRDEEWADASIRCFGMLRDGYMQTTGIRRRGADADADAEFLIGGILRTKSHIRANLTGTQQIRSSDLS